MSDLDDPRQNVMVTDTFMDRFGREDTPAPPPSPGRSRRRRGGSPVVTAVAVIMLLGGLGLLGWVAYQYFGTNIVSQQAFEQERSGLRAQWDQQRDAPATGGAEPRVIPGEAIALLRIPTFGDDYEIPILAGVDLSFLDRGVGHYPSSAQPGEVGNFAVAGHRITHGQPFARLLELDRGDQVIVETRDKIFTYVIDDPPRDLTVKDDATWVLDPVPGEPNAQPTRPLMTLTTCQDLFHSPDRSVGFAHLASTTTKP